MKRSNIVFATVAVAALVGIGLAAAVALCLPLGFVAWLWVWALHGVTFPSTAEATSQRVIALQTGDGQALLPKGRLQLSPIPVEKMPADRIHMYGVVGIGERRGNLFSVTQMVEKPPRDRAPSNLIITGRYILQPEIFDILAAERRGAGGEIQLTDAMIELAKTQPFYGLEFDGRSFDCGSKVGFLTANIAYALDRSDIAPAMRAELKRLLGDG